MNKILEGLFLGDVNDAELRSYKFDSIYDIRRWIPLDEFEDVRIEADLLDALAVLIHEERKQLKNILVYCTAGLERSPLVVAWYLCTYPENHGVKNLKQAYDFIGKRRNVLPRDCWVGWKEREERGFIWGGKR